MSKINKKQRTNLVLNAIVVFVACTKGLTNSVVLNALGLNSISIGVVGIGACSRLQNWRFAPTTITTITIYKTMKFIIWILGESHIEKSGINFLFFRLNVDDKTGPIQRPVPLQFAKDKNKKTNSLHVEKWTEEWQKWSNGWRDFKAIRLADNDEHQLHSSITARQKLNLIFFVFQDLYKFVFVVCWCFKAHLRLSSENVY